MTSPVAETWRLPPRAVLLAALLLLVLAEVGGASMARFKLELARWARGEMQRHPAVHGLVGVRDWTSARSTKPCSGSRPGCGSSTCTPRAWRW